MPRFSVAIARTLSFCLLCCLTLCPLGAQSASASAPTPGVTTPAPSAMEVPVLFDLGIPNTPPIVGFITGGGICEPDGLSLIPGDATEPVLFPYESIDKAIDLNLKGTDEVSLKLKMRDGKEIAATAKVTDAEPILVLRDDVASGAAPATAKVRTFQKAGFRGIPTIEFEAIPEMEVDIEAIKKMNEDFLKALEGGDFDKAIDQYNQMGDALEKSQGDAEPQQP